MVAVFAARNISLTLCALLSLTSALSLESVAFATEEAGESSGKKKNIDEPAPWKQQILRGARSKSGMPEGELFYNTRRHKPQNVRKLLDSTPRSAGDERERKMWTACCLSLEKDYEKASALFDQVPNLDKAPNIVQVRAARSYGEDEKVGKALNLCNNVLAKWEMPEAYQIRAGLYSAQGKLEEAAQDYMKLAKVDANNKRSHLVLASNLLVKLNKPQKALDLLQEASDSEPGKEAISVDMVRANCYKKLGRYKEAIDVLTRAIAKAEKVKGSLLKGADYMVVVCRKERATCYEKLGRPDLARADLQVMEKLNREYEEEMIGRH